jgi:hypothetical protein
MDGMQSSPFLLLSLVLSLKPLIGCEGLTVRREVNFV